MFSRLKNNLAILVTSLSIGASLSLGTSFIGCNNETTFIEEPTLEYFDTYEPSDVMTPEMMNEPKHLTEEQILLMNKLYHGYNVPNDYAKKLLLEGFDYKSIQRFYQLNIPLEKVLTFHDTFKPNAVIILPQADLSGAFQLPIGNEILINITLEYDAYVRVVEREEEVYKALSLVPDIEFFYLAGHGNKISLSLGEKDPAISKARKGEKYTIDLSDIEFEDYLKKLNPNAVIFLHSCSNGEGRKKEDNLANFVMTLSEGRTVYSASKPFSSIGIKIDSYYPFKIDRIVKPLGKDNAIYSIIMADITYTNEPGYQIKDAYIDEPEVATLLRSYYKDFKIRTKIRDIIKK